VTADTVFSILNVDDYPAALYTRSRVLRSAGFEVFEAATGRQALEAVARHRPPLVLLDVNLPDMSGFEVCQRIKADPETALIQVVHLTASSTAAAEQVRGLEHGADGYLVEPLDPEVLVATVRSLERAYRAEARLRAAARHWEQTFEAISDGVCLFDAEGRILRVNTVFARLAGLEAGALGGRRLRDTLEGVDTKVASASRVVYEVTRDERRLRVTLDPMPDAEGAAGGGVCIVTDVTAARAAERARHEALRSERAARTAAEAANRAKDEFLAVVSHELRTPLTARRGWSSMLRAEDLPTERARRAFEVIERNTRAQAQLVDDLLDVSRIVSGKLRLEMGAVNAARIVDAALDAVRRAAAAKGVTLASTVEGELRAIAGDATRLQQVVANLLSNAVKFTPAGGRVEVRLRMGADSVTIEVRDTGAGIAPEFLPRIFERFNQGDASSRRTQGGLGLGLAIVRHITALHQGTVVAASEGRGKGATFTLTLPATPPGSSAVADAAAAASPDLRDVRVLLVENERDALDLFATALEQYGATVVAVADAATALRAFAARVPDVVVSDIGMPGSDGYDLIREIRARPPEAGGSVPALALTAYASNTDSDHAAEAGYQRHVTKPIDPALLARAIAEVLDRTSR
jgi:PAS domain S-box-containing protein